MPPTGVLNRDVHNLDLLKEILGGMTVPLESYVPVTATCDRGVREFFKVDLVRLSPSQRQALRDFMAGYWEVSVDAVEAEFTRNGCPILARHVSVGIPSRYFF